MPERTALVTGAHGFLGRHLARALSQQGYSVHGLGHGAWTREEWARFGLSVWHTGDVTLESLLTYAPAPEPDLIVHCAGSASVAFSMAQPLLDFKRTVETTAAVLEYARLHAPGAAVLVPSSGSVYGSHELGPVAESAPTSPQSAYAVNKLLAEALCASYGRSFGVRSVVVRFFSIYGPGLRKQLLWDACGRLARGEASFAGSGDETRDWMHVDDAAQLVLRALDRASASCPVVNGGTGTGASVREVVTEIAKALGFPGEITFTRQGRPGDPVRFVADNDLARSWAWEPRIGWRDGVRAYCEWFATGAR
jgi:UDP-glucose 4-epimerase